MFILWCEVSLSFFLILNCLNLYKILILIEYLAYSKTFLYLNILFITFHLVLFHRCILNFTFNLRLLWVLKLFCFVNNLTSLNLAF